MAVLPLRRRMSSSLPGLPLPCLFSILYDANWLVKGGDSVGCRRHYHVLDAQRRAIRSRLATAKVFLLLFLLSLVSSLPLLLVTVAVRFHIRAPGLLLRVDERSKVPQCKFFIKADR